MPSWHCWMYKGSPDLWLGPGITSRVCETDRIQDPPGVVAPQLIVAYIENQVVGYHLNATLGSESLSSYAKPDLSAHSWTSFPTSKVLGWRSNERIDTWPLRNQTFPPSKRGYWCSHCQFDTSFPYCNTCMGDSADTVSLWLQNGGI